MTVEMWATATTPSEAPVADAPPPTGRVANPSRGGSHSGRAADSAEVGSAAVPNLAALEALYDERSVHVAEVDWRCHR